MAISEPTILEAVSRYHREYDRYLNASASVSRRSAASKLLKGTLFARQVTSRAKSPKSLEIKLRRFAAIESKDILDVDSVFAQVRDLAAVRIAPYQQNDEKKVVEAVCRRFVGEDGQTVIPDVKDKHTSNASHFYRATHFEVFLPTSDIVGTYANVDGVPCESTGL